MTKQNGFTIVEILISLTIGLFLFSGISLVFVGMRSTSAETSSYGEMQETGRIAISILSDDLMRQGFWGDLSMPLSSSNLLGVPAAPAGECTGDGLNNGTFPTALGTFRTIWGKTADGANEMGCITNAVTGSDILQIKRTVVNPFNTANPLPADRYYLVTNTVAGQIIDSGDAIPAINDSRAWEYQHHVYYVSNDTVGDGVVPVLNLRSLANTMNAQPMIDGVERIRIQYGIDSAADGQLDGVVDAFIPADQMTQALWDNESSSRIVAAKIFVLVRDINPDLKYTNTLSYQLGDLTINATNDNYRRMLFSSTVTLHNGDVEIWQ
ncbi:PilW family protein [Thalassotalea atypica]|uniref:PilW family protein n=1 Tax=Thalassotalea atypica TaxID=2054316 RepID=UPI002572A680|nr:PilW family protein [Thalassotalea atypica]